MVSMFGTFHNVAAATPCFPFATLISAGSGSATAPAAETTSLSSPTPPSTSPSTTAPSPATEGADSSWAAASSPRLSEDPAFWGGISPLPTVSSPGEVLGPANKPFAWSGWRPSEGVRAFFSEGGGGGGGGNGGLVEGWRFHEAVSRTKGFIYLLRGKTRNRSITQLAKMSIDPSIDRTHS